MIPPVPSVAEAAGYYDGSFVTSAGWLLPAMADAVETSRKELSTSAVLYFITSSASLL